MPARIQDLEPARVTPGRRKRIAATALLRLRPAQADGRIAMTLTDAAGGTVELSLTASCLVEIISALPHALQPPRKNASPRIHAWRLDTADSASELHLTLWTAEGGSAQFRIHPGQIAGMATLATYGGLHSTTARSIN